MEWNLFNPMPNFNYSNMKHKLDLKSLENPAVQVIWQDNAENFTQEKIKSIKNYFYKKYNTTNVNVITKVNSSEEVNQTIDVSTNLMDQNYQKGLIKDLLESKNQGDDFEKVMEIDSLVENKMLADDVEVTAFKRWYIKKIKFSNFLSFGENQEINFETCKGITVVESDPPNFGGKTVLTVDLLLFLFFNTTTKTQKAEEIFNRFSTSNKVSVSGEVSIDGEDYLISREISRKKSKAGKWNVKTDLDFFKKLSDGQLINFTGEQRRETEEFIKRSIGTIDDFLMTILTTGSNLEDLLNSKPTARGQVLTRFLGLEFLKKKEEVGKEIYSNFSKTMMSNIYNSETLRQNIDEFNSRIGEIKNQDKILLKNIEDVNNRLNKGQEYKDNLFNQKYTDIDEELLILDVKKLNEDIFEYERQCEDLRNKISQTKVVKPKNFYNEDEHDKIKDEITNKKIEEGRLTDKIDEINQLVTKYGDGIECDHCGIKLMDAKITKAKISELDSFKNKLSEVLSKIKDLDKQDKSFAKLKSDFDEYERNKLIKEKYEVSLESSILKLDKSKDTLDRYEKVQDKVKKNKEIESQILKANLRIDELINEKRGYEQTQSSNEHEVQRLKDDILKNEGIIQKINEESNKEKIYKIYLDVFGKNGISKIIMKTMMPVINQELQRLLEDSSYFRLEIRINEKNEVEFIMIDNSTAIEKLMVSGSGYEKTIAALALRAVLTKICSLPKPNIVVFDEVFGKISNENLDMIGEFFHKMKEYFDKIFVISHNPLINNWANGVIRVKKTENISKVEQLK